MASDSRALTLKLLADVADYQKKLDQSANKTEGFSGKIQEFGKKAAVAFAAAGAAAAAYAGKLLVDGVKAAIADEAAQTRLATSLRNATKATEAQIASTEDYITKTSIAVGVTDDELRPSLQRLAIATGDVTRAQQLQKLALDISAGSGKSLEAVSNALAKAYEGTNTSLTRLGIGLSAAELKSMSFEQITQSLSNTFKNQASIQADTFQGKLTRLQIGFDEAKEAVGSRLIPILTNLLTIFTDKVIPAVQGVMDKFKPLTKAIGDNKEEFKALWDFINKFILPILTGALKNAFSGIVTALSAVVTAVGKVINFFGDMYNAYKKFVDFLKNNPLSKFLDKINPFNNASFSNANFVTGGDNNQSGDFLVAQTDGTGSNNGGVGTPSTGFDYSGTIVESPTLGRRDISALSEPFQEAVRDKIRLQEETAALRERIRSRDSNVNNRQEVTVNIGVVGDPEAAARTINDLLAQSYNRGTGGLVGAF